MSCELVFPRSVNSVLMEKLKQNFPVDASDEKMWQTKQSVPRKYRQLEKPLRTHRTYISNLLMCEPRRKFLQ